MHINYNALLILALHSEFVWVRTSAIDSGWICHVQSPAPDDDDITTSEVINCKCDTGYVNEDARCVPKCDPPCTNGFCIAPNKCQCRKFHRGPLCEVRECPVGYEGPECDEECSEGYYGQNCEQPCACQNGSCNRKTGECSCFKRWFGLNCDEKCECQNDADCNRKTGGCVCKPGYIGRYCEKPCEEDSWGVGCQNRCDHGGHRCNAENGKLMLECKAGRGGKDCAETCDEDFWGPGCRNVCHCGGHACDPINGMCRTGCKSGFFGENCVECACKKLGTKECLPDSGHCVCKEGWEGDRCDKCQSTQFGPSCNNTCACEEGHYHNCDQISGKCNCKPGWDGETCGECICKNGSCDDLTGECNCNSGWRGTKCDEQCLSGWYGDECNHTCKCFQCRFTDGFCFDVVNQIYCPLELFNITSNQCVAGEKMLRVEESQVSDNSNLIILIGALVGAIGLLLIVFIVGVIVYRTRIKVKARNEESVKDENERFTNPSVEPSRPTTPIYEEIPERNRPEPSYNHLVHIPVEAGYLEPRTPITTSHTQATDANSVFVPMQEIRSVFPFNRPELSSPDGYRLISSEGAHPTDDNAPSTSNYDIPGHRSYPPRMTPQTATRQEQEFVPEITLMDSKLSRRNTSEEDVQIRRSPRRRSGNRAPSVKSQSFTRTRSERQVTPRYTPPPSLSGSSRRSRQSHQ